MIYFLLPNMTNANMARYALKDAGITAKIAQTPQSISGRQCSYSVVFQQRHLSNALSIIENESYNLLAVYEKREDGMYELDLS